MTELDALMILNAIPGLSNLRKKKLISHFGSALRILSLTEEDFFGITDLSSKAIENILHFSKDKFLKDEYNLIASQKVSLLSDKEESYPDLLKKIDDSPILLYVKGNIPKDIYLSISIVGSRRASIAGKIIAEKFAYAFSEYGFAVISGLARGIDTSAHRGALRAKGKTIAVLGSGLNCVYPKENKRLFDMIAASSAVISEFPMQNEPLPYNFPRRNRIISGLSLAVIVVEAAMKSGALITADFALEQGREVFAVPSNIDNPTAQGVNNLIKQGSKMITAPEDVIEDLSANIKCYLDSMRRKVNQNRLQQVERGLEGPDLNELGLNEKKIFNCIKDNPIHIDELVNQCGLSSSFASSVLLQLELKNKIKQLPGKLFRKL